MNQTLQSTLGGFGWREKLSQASSDFTALQVAGSRVLFLEITDIFLVSLTALGGGEIDFQQKYHLPVAQGFRRR